RRHTRWPRDWSSDVCSSDLPPVYPGLVVGREFAKTLHAYVGDEITLISPLGDLGPMGILPRSRRFRIAAIFYSGMYEYDATHVRSEERRVGKGGRARRYAND